MFNFGCLSGCEHSEIEFAFNRNGSSWELSNAKRCLASPRQGNADPYKTKPQYTPVAKIKNILFIPSAHSLYSRPPCTFSGRADNACTNLLGFPVCYVRTRGMAEIAESAKPSTFALSFTARARHAWLVRLTRARGGMNQCTQCVGWRRRDRGCFLRGRKALLNDFWYFSSQKSTIKEKFL